MDINSILIYLNLYPIVQLELIDLIILDKTFNGSYDQSFNY